MEKNKFLEKIEKSISSWKIEIPKLSNVKYCKKTDLPLDLTFKNNLEGMEGDDKVYLLSSLEEAKEKIKEKTGQTERILWEHIKPEKPERAKYGIAKAYAFVADTGSVLLKPKSKKFSWASLLAEEVFIIGNKNNIYPDLYTMFQSNDVLDPPYLIVTGSSRTADIEKELVIPAHGPAKLYIMLIPEEPDLNKLYALFSK